MADLIIGIIFHEYLNVIDAQNKLPGPMAAALSLLGEINNALNPQPRTLRGQALGEAVIGDRGHHTEPRGQEGWTETFGWAGSLSLARLEER